MDNTHPYWLSNEDNQYSSKRISDNEVQIRRIPNEELDPFQTFLMKMDYLNSR